MYSYHRFVISGKGGHLEMLFGEGRICASHSLSVISHRLFIIKSLSLEICLLYSLLLLCLLGTVRSVFIFIDLFPVFKLHFVYPVMFLNCLFILFQYDFIIFNLLNIINFKFLEF